MTEHSIWGISTGDYSDFTVHGIWAEKADAEAVVAQLNSMPGGEDYGLQEFSFYPAGDRSFQAWLMAHGYITVSQDGVIGVYERRLRSEVGTEDTRKMADPYMFSTNRNRSYTIVVSGPDPEAVAKAAREKAAEVAALIAEGHDPMEIELDRIARQNPIKNIP